MGGIQLRTLEEKHEPHFVLNKVREQQNKYRTSMGEDVFED